MSNRGNIALTPVLPVEAVAPSLLVDDATADDSDKIFTVPAGVEWEIFFISARLVSTATVGNRQMRIEIDDGTNLLWFKLWTPTQAASLTRDYYAGANLPDDAAFNAAGQARIAFDPRGLILPPGWRVRVYDSAAIAAAADDLTVRIAGIARPQ